MQTITNKISQENKAYQQLQDLGFHIVGNLGVCHLDFYGQWLAFKSWTEALGFINSIK